MINYELIDSLYDKTASRGELAEILECARESRGLSLVQAAKLLNASDGDEISAIFEAARQVKNEIYGKRVVMFAPLYTSNYCQNNCAYCGFSAANKEIKRIALTSDEVAAQAKRLESGGHKRILLVCGEDERRSGVAAITECVEKIYETCDIRRLNVNCAPMDVADFKTLKASAIGTYQIFQETYNRAQYEKLHISGKKRDYDYRFNAPSRAIEAGIDDVGIGPLLGLYDYRYDVLCTLAHSEHLMERYGVGPHTISVPRMRPAVGAALAGVPYPVSDYDFKKLVAVIRLAVPYTGIILSTRETGSLRANCSLWAYRK